MSECLNVVSIIWRHGWQGSGSCLHLHPAQSDALRLDFVLQPGDIQLLHNHQMLHTRALLCPARLQRCSTCSEICRYIRAPATEFRRDCAL